MLFVYLVEAHICWEMGADFSHREIGMYSSFRLAYRAMQKAAPEINEDVQEQDSMSHVMSFVIAEYVVDRPIHEGRAKIYNSDCTRYHSKEKNNEDIVTLCIL